MRTLAFRAALSALRRPPAARAMTTATPSAPAERPQSPLKRARAAESPVLRVKKLSEHATLPVRGSKLAAGFDLAAAYAAVVPAGGKALVKTDLSIALPFGTYARVAPRSGLALKKFIDTGAGVIDADYRGNVGVILFNHSAEDFEVKRGDRIAQLILEKIEYPEVQEVQEIDETERGAGGFGSTGVEHPPEKRIKSEDDGLEAPSSPQSPSSGSADYDSAFAALERLAAGGGISDDKRLAVKKALFSASDRQFRLLSKALGDFLIDDDVAKVVEWLDAFLDAK